MTLGDILARATPRSRDDTPAHYGERAPRAAAAIVADIDANDVARDLNKREAERLNQEAADLRAELDASLSAIDTHTGELRRQYLGETNEKLPDNLGVAPPDNASLGTGLPDADPGTAGASG